MNDLAAPALAPADLQRLLHQADPAALLVPPRILRRVIKKDRGLTGLGLQVPHRKSYVIGRDALLRIAERDELGLAADAPLPETLLLFPRPDAERLELRGPARSLVKYWRLLFHARVHQALGRRLADGKLTADAVQERIRRIGLTEFAEARAVLRQEHFLLPCRDDNSPAGEAFAEYEEFAALYSELRHFAPHLVSAYFPAILHPEAVDAVLAQDVDAAEFFAATRLEGAPDPAAPPPPPAEPAPRPQVSAEEETRPDSRAYRRLLRRAERKAARGNVARAAILRTRAVAAASPAKAGSARAAARRDLDALAQRLGRALGLTEAQTAPWREAIAPLLEPAARGAWPPESRLLYDLQKVCLDQERDTYAVDLVEWVVSWGRKPVLRLLPHQRDVLAVKHLRGALYKLTAVRLADADRGRLSVLLQAAVHAAEHRLRERLRPEVVAALDEVGLTPRNVAEGVSRDKLVGELLDRVLERNFLTMGDLRDAVARNRVKLPDMADPVTFFLGDRLIRANRSLATRLDGVYRRGEIYLRWLQRLSSAAFGNPVGRFLTRFLVLPFGTSFMLIKMWEEIEGLVTGIHHHDRHPLHVNLYAFVILGVFLFLLLHAPAFRRWVGATLKLAWLGMRAVCYDLPRAFLNLPFVRAVLQSRTYLLFYQLLFKPLPWAALAYLGAWLYDAGPPLALGVAAAAFVVASLVLHSRLGLYLEEVTADSLVRTWALIRSDLLPGLVRWVIYFFRKLVEDIERLLYTVDEWLRFRKGDGRLALVVKPALGLVWFLFTYVVRIVINLFVEPTFNPIKHFPVVTVTAKLLVPFYLQLIGLFEIPLVPILGVVAGRLMAWGMVALIPGFGGFLVWELKENWRLYRANQSPTLDAEVVGSHGETVLRLMHPGLHSGTLPKLYAKLRRSKGSASRRQHEALHHVEERLRRFTRRDLLAVLAVSKVWSGAQTPAVGEIHLGTNRIRIELKADSGERESLFLEFEEHAGWLLAGAAADGPTWLARLTPEQRLVFRDALAGFYKLAGVALVREQIAPHLPGGALAEVTEEGLVVWPAAAGEGAVVYPLGPGPVLTPRALTGAKASLRPSLTAQEILFRSSPILWEEWVRTWDLDHAGAGHAPMLPETVRLLPSA